jgi:hypothetical protein
MKRDDANSVRELSDNDIELVAGGAVLGAIPGYSQELPSSLFWTPNVVCIDNGADGGIIWTQPG